MVAGLLPGVLEGMLPASKSWAGLAGALLFLVLGWLYEPRWDYRCNDCGHKWKVGCESSASPRSDL